MYVVVSLCMLVSLLVISSDITETAVVCCKSCKNQINNEKLSPITTNTATHW